MGDQPLRSVTEDERATYRQDGVVRLSQIYPSFWIDRLRRALDDVFSQSAARQQGARLGSGGDSVRGASADVAAAIKRRKQDAPNVDWALQSNDEIRGRSIVETDACGWHEGMRQHDVDSPLVDIIQQLTQSTKINLYSDQLFFKEAGSQIRTPWHQDMPYWLVGGGEMAVAWVTVDTVTKENGAMGYVRGSHLWGKTFVPSDFQTERGTFPEVDGISHAGLTPIDHDALEQADIIYYDAVPGDVIVHHWKTLHGSTGNTSATRSRRAASIRYALEGCHFFRRPSSPEPFRDTVELNNGDPLELAGRFPVVWPRKKHG